MGFFAASVRNCICEIIFKNGKININNKNSLKYFLRTLSSLWQHQHFAASLIGISGSLILHWHHAVIMTSWFKYFVPTLPLTWDTAALHQQRAVGLTCNIALP